MSHIRILRQKLAGAMVTAGVVVFAFSWFYVVKARIDACTDPQQQGDLAMAPLPCNP